MEQILLHLAKYFQDTILDIENGKAEWYIEMTCEHSTGKSTPGQNSLTCNRAINQPGFIVYTTSELIPL